MENVKLFFATNRKHEGSNRWKPTGYGERFSSDGHENLRFGQLELSYNPSDVNEYLIKPFEKDRKGDGEGLSDYLSKQAEKANIIAYEDYTSEATAPIEHNQNSSTSFFLDLKKIMMSETDVLIYIHGYNVSWNEAVGGALALQFMLNSHSSKKDKQAQVVLFSWPSNGSMMPYAAYKSDRSDARNSGKAVGRALLKLKDFLETLHEEAKEEHEILCKGDIHLLCHSMGNYLLQKGLENKFIGYCRGSILPRMFKHVFLCAADVQDDVLEGNNGMFRLHELASNITIYYNHGDLAMNISKYTKNMTDRLGQVGNAHPALVHNKVHQVDCSPIVHGLVEHSYYLWATINKDIWQSIIGLRFDDEIRSRKRIGQTREWIMV